MCSKIYKTVWFNRPIATFVQCSSRIWIAFISKWTPLDNIRPRLQAIPFVQVYTIILSHVGCNATFYRRLLAKISFHYIVFFFTDTELKNAVFRNKKRGHNFVHSSIQDKIFYSKVLRGPRRKLKFWVIDDNPVFYQWYRYCPFLFHISF